MKTFSSALSRPGSKTRLSRFVKTISRTPWLGLILIGLFFLPAKLSAQSKSLYWVTRGKEKVYALPGEEGNPFSVVVDMDLDIATGSYSPEGIATNNTHVFWIDNNLEFIYRRSISGSGDPEVIVDIKDVFGGDVTTFNPYGVFATETHVYWGEWGDTWEGIFRATVTGGNPVHFIDLTTSPRRHYPEEMATDGVNLYWSESTLGEILSAPLAGGPHVTAVDVHEATGTLNGPAGMVCVGPHFYWITSNGKIYRSNKDGTGTALVFDARAYSESELFHQYGAYTISSDGQRLYWGDDFSFLGTGGFPYCNIHSIKLDGSDARTELTTSGPYDCIPVSWLVCYPPVHCDVTATPPVDSPDNNAAALAAKRAKLKKNIRKWEKLIKRAKKKQQKVKVRKYSRKVKRARRQLAVL